MAVTLKEVAELAGVSRSAVSRTFTDGASVSTKTRSKVEKAAAALGYSPNALASSLTTGRTKLIGLIANNFQNPMFLEVFDLYTKELQKRGLRPLLVNLTNETDPANSVKMLRQYSVDGVIVATSTLPTDFARAFADAGLPVVHAFGRYTRGSQVPVVGIDNRDCGEMAAHRLLEAGYKRIGFLGGPQSATSTEDRAAGFLGYLQDKGMEPAVVRYADQYGYDAGRVAMAEILIGDTVDALFCGDDLICMGALDEARHAGVIVPDQMGFIGFNDMTMARWRAYDLTTIRQPTGDIIKSSIELVVALVEEPERATEKRIFPCEIIERGTLLSG